MITYQYQRQRNSNRYRVATVVAKVTFMALLLIGSTANAHQSPNVDLAKVVDKVVKVHAVLSKSKRNKEVKEAKKKLQEFDYLLDEPVKSAAVSDGSGFILANTGMVMTAYHVVRHAKSIKVEFADGDKVSAELFKYDRSADVAVLKLKRAHKSLQKGLSLSGSTVSLAQPVYGIGSSFKLHVGIAAGIISAINVRPDGKRKGLGLIQTDAAINPGNSGGVLVNLDGDVIGLITQIYTTSGAFSGLSFAVPADHLQLLIKKWGV